MNKTTTATPAYKIAKCDDCQCGTCINICKAKQNGSYTFYTVGSEANLAVNTDCTNTDVFATKEQIKECHGTRPKIYKNKITWSIPAQTTTVDYNYYYNNYTTITDCSENPYKIAAPNLLYTEEDGNKTYYTYAGYYDGTNIYNTFSTTEPSNCADCYILLKQPAICCSTSSEDTTTYSINPNIINNPDNITPTTHAIEYELNYNKCTNTNLELNTDYLIYYSIPVCANNTNNCSITINSPINCVNISSKDSCTITTFNL